MSNPLTYVSTPLPEGYRFKISPSAFSNFILFPHNWYRSEVLKEELFSYNTSSVIGTCVHYCAECVSKKIPVDENIINEYIDSFLIKEDYDPEVAKNSFKAMAECLVNDYVLENDFIDTEMQMSAPVKLDYAAAGTCDAVQGTKEDTIVVDYKTYNSKTKPRAMPSYYRYQLLVYAWMLKVNGYNPTRIRLVYVNRNIEGEISEKTNKRLKSYPPEVTVLTESITDEDLDFIYSLMELCVESVEAVKKYPELTHVIFHDPRLKIQ